ncbi:MAG: NusG domain II-containing protein [Blautia wexlerae]
MNRGSHGSVRITVDGEEYGTYSLAKDQTIRSMIQISVRLRMERHSMISATCPDHLCMKQKAIDENGGTIVACRIKLLLKGRKSSRF